MLRINPDNNCEIQKLNCDGVWVKYINVAECSAASTFNLNVNIGGINFGTGQPAASECHDYDLIHESTGITIIPVSLSAGDTIEFSNWKGAATDGFTLPIPIPPPWYCASGQGFALNECHDDPGPAETEDPFQDFYHMRAIFVINNVGYDAFNTTVTIPSGITLQQGYVILNDHQLSDNSGTMQFHAKVCTSANEVWQHTFDFTINDGGWTTGPGDTYSPVWTSGVGWQTSAIGIFINRIFPTNAHITRFKCWYETDGPDQEGNCGVEQWGLEERVIGADSTQIFDDCTLAHTGINSLDKSFEYDITAGNQLEIGTVNISATQWKISKVQVFGTGPQPDWSA